MPMTEQFAREETDEVLCPSRLFGSDKPVQDGDSV